MQAIVTRFAINGDAEVIASVAAAQGQRWPMSQALRIDDVSCGRWFDRKGVGSGWNCVI
jgi:hypothetical protein